MRKERSTPFFPHYALLITAIDFSNAHAQQAWFAKVGAWFVACDNYFGSLNDKINGMN